MKRLTIRVHLLEEALGMTPSTPDQYSKFVEFKKAKLGTKAAIISDDKTKEEIDALKMRVEEMKIDNAENGVDVFPIDPETKKPLFWDYQIRGFFKDSMKALKDCLSLKKVKVADLKPSKDDTDEQKAYKAKMLAMLKLAERLKVMSVTGFTKMPATWVDRGVFVGPRKCLINIPEGSEMGYCERPIRIEKFPKDITSLKSSETVPADSTIKFRVGILNDDDEKYVLACLHYGYLRGFGEWRNSGKGRFVFDVYNEATEQWEPQTPEMETIFGFYEKMPD